MTELTQKEAQSLLTIVAQLKTYQSDTEGRVHIGALYWSRSEITSLLNTLAQIAHNK